MPRIEVRLENDLSVEGRSAIVDGLDAYNREQGFVWAREPLRIVARDPDGTIVGGLLGDVNLGWLFIAALWVDESVRGTGLGTELMRSAEEEARSRECVGVYLDTYHFQARPFYERLGYQLFGELRDCPPGGARYYLFKRLDGAAPSGPPGA